MFNANRALGMLVGLHVGDSLGATLEFGLPRDQDDFHTEIIGGGTFDWEPGAATDDTDLMLCVLQAMSEGEFDPHAAAENFQNWLRKKPKDVGLTTRSAIMAMAIAKDPTKCGQTGEYAAGNGSLMRCAPLALLGPRTLTKKFESATLQTRLTHANPACEAADHVFLDALDLISKGDNIFHAISGALERDPDIEQTYRDFRKLPWSDLPNSGFVTATLCTAFWALENTSSFEDGLTQVVNRGNDSDTCGAVTGALLGAYYGLGGIPLRWVAKVKRMSDIVNGLQEFWRNS